jgi:hypothetical protein
MSREKRSKTRRKRERIEQTGPGILTWFPKRFCQRGPITKCKPCERRTRTHTGRPIKTDTYAESVNTLVKQGLAGFAFVVVAFKIGSAQS